MHGTNSRNTCSHRTTATNSASSLGFLYLLESDHNQAGMIGITRVTQTLSKSTATVYSVTYSHLDRHTGIVATATVE